MPKSKPQEPKTSRPNMPVEYRISEPTKGMGLLPWSWAMERLSNSRTQWVATTRPDGRPHVMVVWGVWLTDRFYFCTSARSRKALNLAANPKCVVCAERSDETVVLEGVAEKITDPSLDREFKDTYRRKYEENADTNQFPLYAVRPQVVFGFVSDPVKWAGSITRWRFRDG